MKRVLGFAESFVLVLAAVGCTMGALISGFMLEVDTAVLGFFWLGTTLALPAVASFKNKKAPLALLAPFLGLFAWKFGNVVNGAKGLIWRITAEYNKWLYVPVFFRDQEATRAELTAFLVAVSVALCFLLYAAICVWRNPFLMVLFTAPIIFLTFVLMYHRPNPWCLAGLLAVYLTILIANALERGAEPSKRRSVPVAILIAVGVLTVAYIAVPQAGYERGDGIVKLGYAIREYSNRAGIGKLKTGMGWPAVSTDGTWRFDTDRIAVADAGVRNIANSGVLEITASETGTYYLRGYSMQRFDGRTWSVNSDTLRLFREEEARLIPSSIAWEYAQLPEPDDPPSIAYMKAVAVGSAELPAGAQCVPYYPFTMEPQENEDTFSFLHTEGSILKFARELPEERKEFYSGRLSEYNELASSRMTYLQINEDTADALREIAAEAGIYPGADRAETADKVGALISSSGRYTLSPYIIPESEDFTVYFLRNSKEGYCIHFATAATLMLRALDVPARIASGFIVNVFPGSAYRPITVTDKNAHAWVEVYFDDIGWLPLEVTPPASLNEVAAEGIYAGVYRPGGTAFEEDDETIPDWVRDQIAAGLGAGAPGIGEGDSRRDAGGLTLRTLLIVAASLSILMAGLAARRGIVGIYRKKAFSQPDANEAVIFVWRYITRICGRSAPPGEYEGLALKARFSPHRITESERSEIIGYCGRLASGTYEKKSLPGRLWLKWGVII